MDNKKINLIKENTEVVIKVSAMEIVQANKNHLDIFRNLQIKVSHLLLNSKDLKAKELKQLADICKIAVKGERLILGLPTSNTKSKLTNKLTTDLILSPEKIAEMDKFFKEEITNQ
jgi:hypothetical protein